MQCFQSSSSNVRIDLRGGDIRMAEQHLYHAQVGAVVEQVGGEGVAQNMR